MLEGISNTFGSVQAASIGCAAVSLYLNRRWCVAAFHKAGSIGANLIGSKNAAEWNQASVESLTLAKQNMFRDLTAATGLIVLGLASGFTKEKIPQQEEASNFPFRAVGISLFVGYLFGSSLMFDFMRKEEHATIVNYNTILYNIFKNK